MNQLLVEHLCFDRGRRRVLDEIELSHPAGKTLCILGPSGSGKSTLLWLLAGLISPTRGNVLYRDASQIECSPRFGFVFQTGGFWEHLSVRTHCEVVLKGKGLSGAQVKQRIDEMLADVALTDLQTRRPAELSGGERQRLALARALVVRPEWLLLDEPTSQLDGPSREALLDLLDRVTRSTGAGVVMATHQADVALRYADTLAILIDGQLVQLGPPKTVYAAPSSLQAARMLGPASEIIDTTLAGNESAIPKSIIVHPHEVTFTEDPGGSWNVVSCTFAGSGYLLNVRHPTAASAWVGSKTPMNPGTAGMLHRARDLNASPAQPAD